MDPSKLVYARLCELASRYDQPECVAELRRLGAIYRWEFERLPEWIRDLAALKESGMEPVIRAN
jgi:hypothetical protein